ncbi:MAG: hypothetical protein PHI37_03375 [Candidatus Gracilibacteria bacterium]|nr:hypothetical protein [Candidatus Gracilibacteria bacterium]
MSENLNQKIINNAVSAYLMLFISWMLLLNKTNPYINNDFVKNHTRSSIVIHIMIILNTLIFLFYKLFGNIVLFGFNLNIIIANIIFFLIGIIFINGIYHAILGKEFKIGNFIQKTKGISLDINNDNNFDEKDKLNVLLSHIPFIGFIVGSKINNEKIENIIKLNLFISVIICLIYILGYNNITSIFVLFYIIFIVFSGVDLYSRDEIISINLPYYFLPRGKIILQKVLFKYFLNYFKGDFKNFEELKIKQFDKYNEIKKIDLEYLNNKENLKLSKNLIYIPILNFIFLFQNENKYSIHIRNGIIISILVIILIILNLTMIISSKWLILILFPICFGLGKLNDITYRMPYIYEIYRSYKYILHFFYKSKKQIKEKSNEVKELNLKVK